MAETLPKEGIAARLAEIRGQLKLLSDYLDPAALGEEAESLEAEMGKPGFWDDQAAAAEISARHARVQRRLEGFRTLESDVDDLAELSELAAEDDEMAGELADQLASVERRLNELEEERLFSGRYDSGDAVVTVHAGAGGTDSQDWAEMLLRMYLRWAERRGFKVEMKEASPGEEAGLKSATFIARGENAYGLFAAERGVHRLIRISPFDSSARRHTSFAQVDVAPLVEGDVEVEIDDGDIRIDTYRASGAGGQHVNKTDSAVRITHIPSGIVVQCQNERSQAQNKATAMQLLRARLLERMELDRAEELGKERGEQKSAEWGSQIRSYFLHPDQRVKDHRTNFEVGDAQRVLDGDLDGFIREYLNRSASPAGGGGGDGG
ncbi:MAG TPA: peptide chain release factor 2 [Solirubrobacterales bacterium]|nr:peptide chain release factor 2 [Solirubrobacterales bacterium]